MFILKMMKGGSKMQISRKSKVEIQKKKRPLTSSILHNNIGVILIAIIISHFVFTEAAAQVGLNGRSMGMAGAYGCMARGSEAVKWNPAVLGLPFKEDHRRMSRPHKYWPVAPLFSLDLASLGISICNNSLNLDLYNEYFSRSYFDKNEIWDDPAKAEIMSAFDDDFFGFSNMQVTGMAFSYEKFAFSVSSFFYTNLKVPRNVLTAPLQGLGAAPLLIKNAEGEMIGGTEFAISTAKVLYEWDYFDYFCLGATFKYFLGHAYSKLKEAEGTVISNEDTLSVNGSYELLTALPFNDRGKGGDGVGLDLGAAAIVGERLTLGVALSNLVGSINFGEVEEQTGTINLNESGLNQDYFDNFGQYLDSIAVKTDTTYIAAEIIKYIMPKAVVLSANYRLLPYLTVEADYHQGLNNTAGGTTIPRLALGTEISYIKFLPLRFGVAVGGLQGLTLAAGFGVKAGCFQMDFAAAGQSGLFNRSKGINFAVSPRISF